MTDRKDFTLGTKLADTTTIELIDAGTDEVLKDSNDGVMFIELYGSDSKHYRKVMNRIVKRNEEARKNKKMSNEELITEVLANCVASWNVEIGGEKLSQTVENALSLFEANRPIREQGVESQHDRTLFFVR